MIDPILLGDSGAVQSIDEAAAAAFRFFLALVITGKMAGLLLDGRAWALGRCGDRLCGSYSHYSVGACCCCGC